MAKEDIWEMRKPGHAGVKSPSYHCGYSDHTLKSMKKCGWNLYKNGEKVQK